MKLVYFGDFTLGVLKDSSVVDVSAAVQDIPHLGPHDLIIGLIERGRQYKARLEKLVSTSKGIPAGTLRLRAPLPRPGKMVCMAGNFMESGNLQEARPL